MGMQRGKGFTLMELMFTIAVMAILASVALPYMKMTQANGRINAASNDLVSDLSRARSEAIMRQHYVKVVATTSTSWAGQGWTVSDMGLNGVTAGPQLISRGGLGVITAATTPAATSVVWFTPTGLVQTALLGAALDLQFKVCDSSITGDTGRTVTLTRFGRLTNIRHPDPTLCAS